MDISKVSIGKDCPNQINVIIEVPEGIEPVKYEMDKDSGALFVDRIMQVAMRYPANYGFIPHTLGGDGDPLDVLVLSPAPLLAGCVVPCRPIGVLMMTDEGGEDEKLIAVPTQKMHPLYNDINSVDDLPEFKREQIKHFFEHYKALEKGKWVKVESWEGIDKAKSLIEEAIERLEKDSKAA